MGTKSCWDGLTQLRNCLSKINPSTERTMKKEDGFLLKTPQETEDVFHTHFHNLYGVPPKYVATVIEAILQRPVVQRYDTHPSDKEIISTVSKLNEKTPVESAIPTDFWHTELSPTEWENGLLTILAKKRIPKPTR